MYYNEDVDYFKNNDYLGWYEEEFLPWVETQNVECISVSPFIFKILFSIKKITDNKLSDFMEKKLYVQF